MLWIFVLIAFFAYGLYTIQGMMQQWEENADITSIKNFSADVREIQFPTVTICPKGWPNDRFGFIRAFLNEYDLENEDFKEEIYQQWKFYLDKFYELYGKAVNDNVDVVDLIIRGKNLK